MARGHESVGGAASDTLTAGVIVRSVWQAHPPVTTRAPTTPRSRSIVCRRVPFCERVVRALEAYGVPYRSRFVEPMHSERNVVKRLTGKRTVPAIVDRSTSVTMSESANIVDYVERTYGEES